VQVYALYTHLFTCITTRRDFLITRQMKGLFPTLRNGYLSSNKKEKGKFNVRNIFAALKVHKSHNFQHGKSAWFSFWD